MNGLIYCSLLFLVFYLLAIGVLGILPPFYWWVWNCSLLFYLLAIGVLGILPSFYWWIWYCSLLFVCILPPFYWWIWSSASLLGLFICLLPIDGIGLLPPCYWWDWSSASLLLVGLVCCLLAISGIGLLLPFYWWVWTPASSYWWVRASGGSGILPPLLLVGSDLQAPFLNCCIIFCRALLLMIV